VPPASASRARRTAPPRPNRRSGGGGPRRSPGGPSDRASPPRRTRPASPSAPPVRLEDPRPVEIDHVVHENAPLEVLGEEREGRQRIVEVPVWIIAGEDHRLLGPQHLEHL